MEKCLNFPLFSGPSRWRSGRSPAWPTLRRDIPWVRETTKKLNPTFYLSMKTGHLYVLLTPRSLNTCFSRSGEISLMNKTRLGPFRQPNLQSEDRPQPCMNIL